MIIPWETLLEKLSYDAPIVWAQHTLQRNVFDNEYYVPELPDVENEVETYMGYMRTLNLSYIQGQYDCNSYATLLYGFVRLQAWMDGAELPPWPFGQAFSMAPVGHAWNFCLVRFGDKNTRWISVEPQTGEIGDLSQVEHRQVWLTVI